jgi:uracil-DNA glycosylase
LRAPLVAHPTVPAATGSRGAAGAEVSGPSRPGQADPHSGLAPGTDLARLERRITRCRRCPRLVEWRERVAVEKRAAFATETYWGRPVTGFGDQDARVLILGLAPAAHGGNRTGRVFTGDRSGDWLFASLHRTGFANQARSVSLDDGLRLDGAFIAAAVRCAPPANRPLPSELANCLPYVEAELRQLPNVRVIVCLGAYAWAAASRIAGLRPRPRFAHAAEHQLADGRTLLGSFHPSQQNTFTGKLTEPMLDAVFARARTLADATH